MYYLFNLELGLLIININFLSGFRFAQIRPFQ